jgi:hypothetical protein
MEPRQNISALGSAAPLKLCFLRDYAGRNRSRNCRAPERRFRQAFGLDIIQKYQTDWDRQIKEDPGSGALDFLIQEISDDILREGLNLSHGGHGGHGGWIDPLINRAPFR